MEKLSLEMRESSILMPAGTLPLSRRRFLCGGGLLLAAVCLEGCRATRNAPTGRDYYLAHQEVLLKDFDVIFGYVGLQLAATFDQSFTDDVLRSARADYAALLPDLPYIGGDDNELTENLVQSSAALTYYLAVRDQGGTARQAGDALYRGVEAMFKDYPAFLMRLATAARFTLGLKSIRRDAERSQHRSYPGDWVYAFVEGEKDAFDWGIDYTECGICKLFSTHRASEFTPYLCLLDFPTSKVANMGLERHETLAGGAPRCDFRYRCGRPTTQGWDTEASRIG